MAARPRAERLVAAATRGLTSSGPQWRPCRIEAGPLKRVAEWAERYRHIWEARLDRLDDYLQELKEKEKKHDRKQRGK
jgi:hypothetical protein